MRKYELTAVFAGTISDTDVEAALARVQSVITEAGATNVVLENLGKHHLMYQINLNSFGHYASFVFEAESPVTAKINGKVRLNPEVLRFAIELHNEKRHKRTPQIAETVLIKASREKERYEERERPEREERAAATPAVFPAGHTEKTDEKSDEKPVDLEEIDKKLDQLLKGDLTPSV